MKLKKKMKGRRRSAYEHRKKEGRKEKKRRGEARGIKRRRLGICYICYFLLPRRRRRKKAHGDRVERAEHEVWCWYLEARGEDSKGAGFYYYQKNVRNSDRSEEALFLKSVKCVRIFLPFERVGFDSLLTSIRCLWAVAVCSLTVCSLGEEGGLCCDGDVSM